MRIKVLLGEQLEFEILLDDDQQRAKIFGPISVPFQRCRNSRAGVREPVSAPFQHWRLPYLILIIFAIEEVTASGSLIV